MPQIRFQCYVCNQELQVTTDKAGRKAKCIQCGTVLTIPAAAAEEAAAPHPPNPKTPLPPAGAPPRRPGGEEHVPQRRGGDEHDERRREEDRSPRRRDDYDDRGRDYDDDDRRDGDYYDNRGPRPKKWKSNWPRLKLGMLLSFIGMCVVGGAFALEHVGVLIATIGTFGRGGPGDVGSAIEILTLIGNIVMLLGFLCLLAGQVFWIFISNKHGGLAWAIVCLSVGGFALLWFLIFRFLPIVSQTQLPYGVFVYFRSGSFDFGIGNAILPTFSMIFIAVHMMMVGFYVRAFGQTAKDRWVSSRGMQMIVIAAIAAAYQLIWPFIGWAFMPRMGVGGGGVGAMVGIWIVYWGGVITFILLYISTILTLNLGRATTDQ